MLILSNLINCVVSKYQIYKNCYFLSWNWDQDNYIL